MQKEKRNMFDIVILVIIITLIFARLFLPEDKCGWINAINFAGIIMACYSLYFNVYQESAGKEKVNLITGIFVCLLAVLFVVEVLIILNIINFSNMANDIITLLTLVISLPANLYKKLVLSYILK